MELKVGDKIIIDREIICYVERETPCYFFAGNYSIRKDKLNDYEDKFVVIKDCFWGKEKHFATKLAGKNAGFVETEIILRNIEKEIKNIGIEIDDIKNVYEEANEYFGINKENAKDKMEMEFNDLKLLLDKAENTITSLVNKG